MSSPPTAGLKDLRVVSVIPILRMYDVAATIRFYIDYLGCSLDWQSGEGDRPVYLQVSRNGMKLHLSSHHDDGTPGTAVSSRYTTSTHCTPNSIGADIRSSIRALAQVRGTSERCSSSILPPTGFASTSPHHPAKATSPVSKHHRTISLGMIVTVSLDLPKRRSARILTSPRVTVSPRNPPPYRARNGHAYGSGGRRRRLANLCAGLARRRCCRPDSEDRSAYVSDHAHRGAAAHSCSADHPGARAGRMADLPSIVQRYITSTWPCGRCRKRPS